MRRLEVGAVAAEVAVPDVVDEDDDGVYESCDADASMSAWTGWNATPETSPSCPSSCRIIVETLGSQISIGPSCRPSARRPPSGDQARLVTRFAVVTGIRATSSQVSVSKSATSRPEPSLGHARRVPSGENSTPHCVLCHGNPATVSPLFASMLTGIVIANLAGNDLRLFERFIFQAEPVVGAVFGMLAGMLLEVGIGATQLGFALGLVAVRLLAKPVIWRLFGAPGELGSKGWASIATVRQGRLAIAVCVSLYLVMPGEFASRVLTVIVIAGIVCDLVAVSIITLAPIVLPPAVRISQR